MKRIISSIAVLCCFLPCLSASGHNWPKVSGHNGSSDHLWPTSANAGSSVKVSKWKLSKHSNDSFEQLWEADKRHIAANACGDAYLEAPVCANLKAGDCWTFHIPVRKLKEGTFIEVDLMFGNESTAESNFVFEYLDGREWIEADSFTITGKYNSPSTIIGTFRLKNKIKKGEVLARIRAIEDTAPGSSFKLMPYGYIGAYCSVLGTDAPTDTTYVGWLGNSFTFVNSADFILKELAWHEGHYLNMRVNTYPGASFKTHMTMKSSIELCSGGIYDWFILQDQSEKAARFGKEPDDATANVTEVLSVLIKFISKDVKLLLEHTWAFSKGNYAGFGSYEAFDEYSTKGVRELARIAGASISPVAEAFAIVRNERPDIEIYSTDNHHPGAYGAYLKACVNYLSMFRTPFRSDKANYGLDPDTCSYLRGVAERVVFQRFTCPD